MADLEGARSNPPPDPNYFIPWGISRNLCEIRQANTLFLHLNPLFLDPGSAPDKIMCRGGVVVERRTLNQEVLGSIPTGVTVLCP